MGEKKPDLGAEPIISKSGLFAGEWVAHTALDLDTWVGFQPVHHFALSPSWDLDRVVK